MARAIPYQIAWDNFFVPVKIYREWRTSIRFSIGRKSAIIRLPLTVSQKGLERNISKLKFWLQDHFKQDEKLASRFIVRKYEDREEFIIRDRKFILNISRQERKTSTAKIKDEYIVINLNQKLTKIEESETIQKLLSRVLAKYYLSEVVNRVQHWNKLYFKKEIKSVRLKYNQSNWGSCSSKNNINLSTRLLLAPFDVLDYVIVHELTHLIEMNHSKKFWNLVKSVMPDYKLKEDWLKKNGHLLKF